jgi:hypothetical protein
MLKQNPQARRPEQKKDTVMKKSQFKTFKPLSLFSAAAVWTPAVALLLAATAYVKADPGNDNRAPELPSPTCDSIQAPEGNKVVFHAYAIGVQIYRWNGTAWAFVAPAATLYANADYDGQVGTHYVGPTWESNSGSKVLGRRVAGCTPDSSAIPWLLLQAVSTDGPGIFHRVTYVQRVNTVGGLAPTAPGSFVGEEADVPYTAEYYFYRAAND